MNKLTNDSGNYDKKALSVEAERLLALPIAEAFAELKKMTNADLDEIGRVSPKLCSKVAAHAEALDKAKATK